MLRYVKLYVNRALAMVLFVAAFNLGSRIMGIYGDIVMKMMNTEKKKLPSD